MMLYNLYVFDHNVLHMCFWTLPAIIAAAAMVIVGVVPGHNQKKREKKFEEELAEKLQGNLEGGNESCHIS